VYERLSPHRGGGGWWGAPHTETAQSRAAEQAEVGAEEESSLPKELATLTRLLRGQGAQRTVKVGRRAGGGGGGGAEVGLPTRWPVEVEVEVEVEVGAALKGRVGWTPVRVADASARRQPP
jgi:hypothetical protein